MGSVTHRQWVGAQVTVAAITLEEWGERGVNMEWELGSRGGLWTILTHKGASQADSIS